MLDSNIVLFDLQMEGSCACDPRLKLLEDIPVYYDGLVCFNLAQVSFRFVVLSVRAQFLPWHILQIWEFPSSVVLIVDIFVLSSNAVALKGQRHINSQMLALKTITKSSLNCAAILYLYLFNWWIQFFDLAPVLISLYASFYFCLQWSLGQPWKDAYWPVLLHMPPSF